MEELSQHQRDLMYMGKCPFCEQTVRGYRRPSGYFVASERQHLKHQGIDPDTGHKLECPHKDIRLQE